MILLTNLALASFLAALCFLVHFSGIIGLVAVLRRHRQATAERMPILHQAIMILLVVGVLFTLHSIQIWLYAWAYVILGEFPEVTEALYYSVVTFTTVGFGDLTVSDEWRLFASTEALTGFLLIGWSTAILVGVSQHLFEEV